MMEKRKWMNEATKSEIIKGNVREKNKKQEKSEREEKVKKLKM